MSKLYVLIGALPAEGLEEIDKGINYYPRFVAIHEGELKVLERDLELSFSPDQLMRDPRFTRLEPLTFSHPSMTLYQNNKGFFIDNLRGSLSPPTRRHYYGKSA